MQTKINTENYEMLDFDTKLFGFKVARILPQKLTYENLSAILADLKNVQTRLIYWFSDSTDEVSQNAAKTCGGFLASEQVTYVVNLKNLQAHLVNHLEVEEYQSKNYSLELEHLVLLIGEYSRFRVDPKLPKECFLKMYRAWLENSINGSIAEKILVIKHANKIIGMITLGVKNGRGDIGLLAVDPAFRGQKIGANLINAAANYFIGRGLSKMQAVTQKAHLPSCKLYEKCGFYSEKTANCYHFWYNN